MDNIIELGQERKWKFDTNHERFTIIEKSKTTSHKDGFIIQYGCGGRKQLAFEEDLLNKSELA